MENLRLIFLLTSFLVINSFLSAQQETLSNTGEGTEIIDKEIPSLMKQYFIPGLLLAVIRNGHIDYVKGFGVKNINTKNPVNNNTIFPAASLTKPVFSYLVLNRF